MRLRMWMYDLAREQGPSLGHLRGLLDMTREAGYNAFGLYMEHRFAYPSAPWAAGRGCVTPEMVRKLVSEYPDVQIVPFLNLLGHFEGMLYTEEGKRYREELFSGMQACPSSPAFVSFAGRLLDDVLGIFDSEIVHIGGDETRQLGACPVCAARTSPPDPPLQDDPLGEGGSGSTPQPPSSDTSHSEEGGSKALLYGSHFGPLARRVVAAGRRPAVWGDMFLEHPSALEHMPGETVIFDWQYFGSAEETSRGFREKGFDVVCCPTIQTYNATWMHLPQSEENVRRHVLDARAVDALGVCVTTWECGLFGSYDTLLPASRACGEMLTSLSPGAGEGAMIPTPQPPSSDANHSEEGGPHFLRHYLKSSERYEEWARLMGVELQEAGGAFAWSGTRSSLRCRFLLYSNPFLAWMHHAEELCGPVGDKALEVVGRSLLVAPNEATKGVSLFARSAIEFVRLAEAARLEYASGRPEAAVLKLALARPLFDDLEAVARRTHARTGGSLADIERCRAAKDHVERVIKRIRAYGDGSLGYLPAYEVLTHPKFVPHDQSAWWLINSWANE